MGDKREYIKIKKTWIPIYHANFNIILSNSTSKIEKFIKDIDMSNPYASAIKHYNKGNCYSIVLNFDREDSLKITHGIIAHECLHIVNMILVDRGVLPDFNNDEPLTYLLEYITNKVHKFINKKGFKVSRYR